MLRLWSLAGRGLFWCRCSVSLLFCFCLFVFYECAEHGCSCGCECVGDGASCDGARPAQGGGWVAEVEGCACGGFGVAERGGLADAEDELAVDDGGGEERAAVGVGLIFAHVR